jgi:ABC-2 type transport system ATP-binding protein
VLFRSTELLGERTIEITYNKDRMNAGEVLLVIQGLGLGIVDVTTKEADLEDVFLRLTSAA